jgi:hypothetical protein
MNVPHNASNYMAVHARQRMEVKAKFQSADVMNNKPIECTHAGIVRSRL